MQSTLREFGYKRGKDFWKTYKSLYKTNTGNDGPILQSTCMQGVRECLRIPEGFFDGRHLSTQEFHEDPYAYMKRKNSVNLSFNEHNDDLIEDAITISELEQALKELPPTGSFDIDNIHILILKHLGSRATLAVLHLFNKCWAEVIWPCNISKVIFISKLN